MASRNVGASGIAEKKRLSTIPASPATKPGAEEAEHNKENAIASTGDKPVRPALGSRKSTRSVLIEQQIREFELVNSMLQAAMASDGANEEEKQNISEEAAATISKLKSDLAKVREFERTHGRLPTNAELEEAASVAAESEARSPIAETASQGENAGPDTSVLQTELAQSKEEVNTLHAQLAELKTKLEEFSKSAEEENRIAQATAELIQKEHVAKIEELMTLNESKLGELEIVHKAKIDELASGQQSEVDALTEKFTSQVTAKEAEASQLRSELDELQTSGSSKETANQSELEKLNKELEELRAATDKEKLVKDAEIERLRLDLETRKIESESMSASEFVPSPSLSPTQSTELEEAQKKLEAAQTRHQAAKENAKTKIARLQEELETKTQALKTQHNEELETLREKLIQAETASAEKQKQIEEREESLARINEETCPQGQEMQSLKKQLVDLEQAKDGESESQSTVIAELQEKLQILEQQKVDDLAAAQNTHLESIREIENQLNDTKQRLQDAEETHKSQLEESLSQSAEDLSKAKVELQEVKADHTSKLDALQAELQKSLEQASSTKGDHDKNISTLQSQLDEAKTALVEALDRHEKLLQTHELESSTAKEELARLKATYDKELQQARSEALAKHGEEIAGLKVTHTGEMKQLEEKVHSSQKEISTLKKSHATQIQQLEEQMKASLADLETLEAGHVAELDRVKVAAEESHQRAVGETEKTHVERVRQLEQQLNAVEAELSNVKAGHAEELAEMERRRVLDQEVAMSALSESHANSIKELEAKLRSAQTVFESSKAEHTEQIQTLEAEIGSRHTEAIESLKSSHAELLKEAESNAKASQEKAIEDACASLVEEKRQLELQANSLKSDLEGTRFQLQSLKGILQSMDEESKSKEQEHAEALEKMDQELSMAVQKVAEKSTQMMTVQSNHDQTLAEVKHALQAKSQEQLENLRSEHEKALAELQATLEKEHQQALDRIMEEHAKSKEADQEKSKLQHEELERKMKEVHDTQMDEIMKTLESQWKSQVDQLEATNAATSARLTQTTTDHADAIESLISEHEAELAKLQADLDVTRQAAEAPKDTTELDNLRDQLTQSRQQIELLEKKHQQEMAAAIESHEASMAAVKQELDAVRKSAEERPDPVQFEELRSQYVQAQSSLEELHDRHEKAIRETQVEYDDKIEKLYTELNEVKKGAEDMPSATELQNIKADLEDAKKSIASLEAELDGAMLEVETQRGMADAAQTEVNRLKQAQKEVVLPSPKPRAKSRSPRRKSINPLTPRGPKGLESSKWATPEDAAPAEEQPSGSAGETSASGLRGGDVASQGNDAAVHSDESSSAPPVESTPTASKRNIAGQLAGIHEEIKQLSELSDEMFDDHQKMARTLNKVDDTTTTTVDVEEQGDE